MAWSPRTNNSGCAWFLRDVFFNRNVKKSSPPVQAPLTSISGVISVTLSGPTLAATGTVGSASASQGNVSVTLPPPSFSAFGQLAILANSSVVLAAPTLAATGALRISGSVSITLPAPTLSSQGGSPGMTTPVITQTSTAGSAPFTFDAVLNEDNTFAGYYLRVQVAANSGGNFTTTTQDIVHLLTESEITSGSVDLTGDGFTTPSGAMSLRCRIEREDGVVSGWSNVLTDTISASVAKWTSTTGAYKASFVSLSPGNLQFQGSSGVGAWYGVAATIDGNTKSQWELTLDAAATDSDNRIGLGLFNASSTDLSGGRPGVANALGFIIQTSIGSATFDLFRNNAGSDITWTAGSNNAVGDTFTLVTDTSGAAGSHTLSLYRTRSGVTTQIGTTLTGQTLTGFTRAHVHMVSNVKGTANFGASTFARALDSGFNFYG